MSEQNSFRPMPAPESLEPQALVRLRDEMIYSERNQLIDRAYVISRQLGDGAVLEHDASGEVGDLLRHSNYYARPQEARVSEGAKGATHDEELRQLNVDKDAFVKPEALTRHLRESGVELKHPADDQFLSLLAYTGHESGHALLAGIGGLYRSPRGIEQQRLQASRLYLKTHPEQGITGNWYNDVWIREEQFAEGYGRAVVDKAIDMLGYDAREKQALLEGLAISADFDGEDGENQLDHLDVIEGTKHMGDIIKASSSEAQKYPGLLGYSKPLSVEEIAQQLYDTQDLLKVPETNTDVDIRQWHANVQVSERTTITEHLSKLQTERQRVLAEKRQAAEYSGAVITGVGQVVELQLPRSDPETTARRQAA